MTGENSSTFSTRILIIRGLLWKVMQRYLVGGVVLLLVEVAALLLKCVVQLGVKRVSVEFAKRSP